MSEKGCCRRGRLAPSGDSFARAGRNAVTRRERDQSSRVLQGGERSARLPGEPRARIGYRVTPFACCIYVLLLVD